MSVKKRLTITIDISFWLKMVAFSWKFDQKIQDQHICHYRQHNLTFGSNLRGKMISPEGLLAQLV